MITSLEELPAPKTHSHEWTGGPRGGAQLRSPYREETIDKLIDSDGPYCRAPVCFFGRDFGSNEAIESSRPRFRYEWFTVDHINGRRSEHWFDNERLAHWYCNKRADPQHERHSSRHPTHTHADASRAIEARRDAIRESPTTTSGVLLNLDHEPDFRRACFQYLLRGVKEEAYRFDRREMKANAREASDTGRDAAYSYMERLFSSQEGPLTDVDPVTGKKRLVRFKDPADYSLKIEELEAKYPKEGRAFVPEATR